MGLEEEGIGLKVLAHWDSHRPYCKGMEVQDNCSGYPFADQNKIPILILSTCIKIKIQN